jgi:hypothetical protein
MIWYDMIWYIIPFVVYYIESCYKDYAMQCALFVFLLLFLKFNKPFTFQSKSE